MEADEAVFILVLILDVEAMGDDFIPLLLDLGVARFQVLLKDL